MKKLLSLLMFAASVVSARAELLYIDAVRSGSAPRKEVFATESAARPCSQECRDYESITLRFVNDGSEVVYTISYEQVQELGLNFLHMLCCDLVPLAGPLDLEERNHRGQLRYPDLSAESFGLIMRLHKEGYDHEAAKFTTRSFDNFLRTVVDEGLKAGRPVLGCKTPLTLAFKLARVLDAFGSVEPVRLLMEVATSNEYLKMITAEDIKIVSQMACSIARHIDTAFIPRVLVPNFKVEKTLSGHTESISSIAWSPNGKSLASAGYDRIVRVWNIEGKPCTPLKGHTDWIESIAWSPNGKYLASAGIDRIVRVWNIENNTSTPLEGHTSLINSIAWSPDGKLLASTGSDRIVRLWNIKDNTHTELSGHTGPILLIAWSPDGKLLASTGSDRIVRLWNIKDNTRTPLSGHTDLIRSIAWSPNGKYLASAGRDGIVRVWNIENNTHTELEGHTGCINSLAWSPNGKFLAGAGNDSIIRIWNIEAKTCTPLLGHTDYIHSIAWSPNGKFLASAGIDTIVRIWSNEALDKCSSLQKLFILVNAPKQPIQSEKTGSLVTKVLQYFWYRVTRSDDTEQKQWLEVYQSLPDQAKKLLDKDTQEIFEHLMLFRERGDGASSSSASSSASSSKE